MRWIKKRILDKNFPILEVKIYDEDDRKEIRRLYSDAKNIQISLSNLSDLHLFSSLETLYLTSGELSETGLEELYKQKNLKYLILDYEETDSDKEGIQLYRFRALQYVISRSNLNIRSGGINSDSQPRVEIVNWYAHGRPLRISLPEPLELCRAKEAIFFSTESQSPASVALMRILNQYTENIEDFATSRYTDTLESVAIIPICISDAMLNDGFGKERCYISLKRKEADVRLHMDFDVFISSTEKDREGMCYNTVKKSVELIAKKDPSFHVDRFLSDIRGNMNTEDGSTR